MYIFRTIAELKKWRSQIGRDSLQIQIGFVPTMGALHRGHARLLEVAKKECDFVVLSIFVNPTQFGPNEDFSKYPRTLENDLELARKSGVQAVFLPTNEEMYPPGYSTYVEETSLTQDLCGKFRPGHFRGVTTIVLKLLHLVQPHRSFFGLKDAQQFFTLWKMAKDLDLPYSIEGVETVREHDGLALSSRNRYLTTEDREKAPYFSKILKDTGRLLEKVKTENEASQILSSAKEKLQSAGFQTQYLEFKTLPALDSPQFSSDRPLLLAGAAYLGQTRLIDNEILHPDALNSTDLDMRIH